MAHRIGDRILETITATIGTGNFTIAATTSGYKSLDSFCTSNADTIDVVLVNGTQWEYTRATRVSAGVYSRATPYASSTGSAINFTAGTTEVWCDFGAFFAEHLNTVEISIASAATCDALGLKGLRAEVTGTTAITSFGTGANKLRFVRFSNAAPGAVTHHATTLIIPGGTRTPVQNEVWIIVSDASSNVRVIAMSPGNTAPNPYPPGHVFGLTLSNNAGDATNDIDIAAGSARDGSDIANLILAASITKRLDAAWTVGTNQGGLDTGSIANALYYVWLIRRSDTGVVDVLFSTSATSPTMPTNYDQKRRIGAFYRAGAVIRPFRQVGDHFWLVTGVEDLDSAAIGTSRTLVTMTTPPNMTTIFRAAGFNSGADVAFIIQPTAETDAGPTFTSPPGVSLYSEVSNRGSAGQFTLDVDASSQIAVRAGVASSNMQITTIGWIDTRGR